MSNATLAQTELARRIVFEDAEVVVVDKPWNLPSTGRHLRDPDCLQYALIQRYVSMTWAVHQLDADTTGLNVFVKQRRAVPKWQARMRYPTGTKEYLAVVHGRVAADQWIDAPIGSVRRDPDCLGVAADGRPARSHLSVVDTTGAHSLLRVTLATGRTHQIRIHCSSIGHPLVGERWYRAEKCHAHVRQALHAADLRFADALEPAALHCALPADLTELLDTLGLTLPR